MNMIRIDSFAVKCCVGLLALTEFVNVHYALGEPRTAYIEVVRAFQPDPVRINGETTADVRVRYTDPDDTNGELPNPMINYGWGIIGGWYWSHDDGYRTGPRSGITVNQTTVPFQIQGNSRQVQAIVSGRPSAAGYWTPIVGCAVGSTYFGSELPSVNMPVVEAKQQLLLDVAAVDVAQTNREARADGTLHLVYGATTPFGHEGTERSSQIRAIPVMPDAGFRSGEPDWYGSHLQANPDGREAVRWTAAGNTFSGEERVSCTVESMTKYVTVKMVDKNHTEVTHYTTLDLKAKWTDKVKAMVRGIGGPDIDITVSGGLQKMGEKVDKYGSPDVANAHGLKGEITFGVGVEEIPVGPAAWTSAYVRIGAFMDLTASGKVAGDLVYDPYYQDPWRRSQVTVEGNGEVKLYGQVAARVDPDVLYFRGQIGASAQIKGSGSLVSGTGGAIRYDYSVGELNTFGQIEVIIDGDSWIILNFSARVYDGVTGGDTILIF